MPAPLLQAATVVDNVQFYSTRSMPLNKPTYRYTPCTPAAFSTPLLQQPPGALVRYANPPALVYRTIPTAPEGARFAWEDRSPLVLITEDAKSICAEPGRGWRGARGNVSLREGGWYWEVVVERGGGAGGREQGGEGEGSWVRVGVGRRESSISAPVGIDG